MVKLDTNYAESSGPVGMRLRLPTSEVREWLQIDAEKRSNSEAVSTSPFRLKLLRYSSTVNGGDFRRLRTLRVAAQKTLGTELRWP